MPNITLEAVQEKRSKQPRRICFAQKKCLKKSTKPEYCGSLGFPFSETIKIIFETEFPFYKLFYSKYDESGVWRSISSEQEYEEIESWIERHKQKVFLKDCLDASFALSLNKLEPKQHCYTEIGSLENLAKHDHCKDSINALVDICESAVLDFQIYRDADFLCSVPPTKGKDFDLPSEIVERLSQRLNKANITNGFSEFKKNSIKDMQLEARWREWAATGLSFSNVISIAGKSVILVDDLYQSGSTMQFVASVLQLAGARAVYGLSVVKSLGDTDNTRA